MILTIQTVIAVNQCNPLFSKLLYKSTSSDSCVGSCGINDNNLINRQLQCLKLCNKFSMPGELVNEVFSSVSISVVYCDDSCPVFVNSTNYCVTTCFNFVQLIEENYHCVVQCDSNLTFQQKFYRYCTDSTVCPDYFPYLNSSERNCYENCSSYVKVEGSQVLCEPSCISKLFITEESDKICIDSCPKDYYKHSTAQQHLECVKTCSSGIYGENQMCADSCPKYFQINGSRTFCVQICSGFLQTRGQRTYCIAKCDMYVQVGANSTKHCVDQCQGKYFDNSFVCKENCANFVIENQIPASSNLCSASCLSAHFIVQNEEKHCIENCSAEQFKLVVSGYFQCLQDCPENFDVDGNRVCICNQKLENATCQNVEEPKISVQTIIIIAVSASVVAILITIILIIACGIMKKKRAEEKKQTLGGKFLVARDRKAHIVKTSQANLRRGQIEEVSSSSALKSSFVSVPGTVVKKKTTKLVPAAGDVPFF